MAVVSAGYQGWDSEGWKWVWKQKQRRKGSKAKQKQPREAGASEPERAGHDAATFRLGKNTAGVPSVDRGTWDISSNGHSHRDRGCNMVGLLEWDCPAVKLNLPAAQGW